MDCFKIKKISITKVTLIIFTVLFLIYSVLPLLKPGFFEVHDQTHFERLVQIDNCIKAGIFPCRFASDFYGGKGYPIFNFYAPLSYYLAEILYLLGFGLVNSIKGVFILSVLISFFGMYLVSKTFWGKLGGLLSALVFIYTPYRAVNLYIRGALSESLALSLVLPALFFLLKSLKEKKLSHALLGGIFYGLVILSHNITGMIFTAFLCFGFLLGLFYKKFFKKSSNIISPFIIFLVFGLLISCFFWAPALFERQYVNTGSMTKGILDFHLHFPKISQLIYSSWTYGGSGANFGISKEDMSFQVGIINWLSFIPAAFLFLKIFKKSSQYFLPLFFGILLFLLALFLTTSKSLLLWESFPPFSYIQFPWRFLGWTMLFSSFLSGSLVLLSKDKLFKIILFFSLGVIVFILNFSYFSPRIQFKVDENIYVSKKNLTLTSGVTDEYLPIWVKIGPTEFAGQGLILNQGENLQVDNLQTNFFKTEFSYNSNQNNNILINYIYYPGFQASIDKIQLPVTKDNKTGLLALYLPKGRGTVILSLEETPLRKFSNYTSLLGVIFTIAIFYLLYRKYDIIN